MLYKFLYYIKKIIYLFTPPILKFETWSSKIKKLNKIENEFEYENNFYSRHSFILRALKKKSSYLEIGVSNNDVFNTIPLDLNNKIGVDPFSGGTHRTTSDIFFKTNKKKFDVIFIDGLHEYKQCQRDCINSLKFLKPNGIIIFHDFLPRNSMEASNPRKQKIWCGDIWKVAVEINNSPFKKFKIVNIDMGIGIFKPQKKFKYKKLNNLKNMNYNDFHNKYFKSLPIINSEEALNFISK